MDPKTWQPLEETFSEMESAKGTPDLFTEADVQFHLHLAEAADNRVLASVLGTIRHLLSIWIKKVITNPKHPDAMQQTVTEHRAIYGAVHRRDAKGARLATANHVKLATASLLSLLQENDLDDFAGDEQRRHTLGGGRT